VTGECPKGEKGREQYRIRKSPLKDHLWDLVEEVFKDEKKRGLMFDEKIHFLEEEDDHIDEDQSAQAEKEYLQIFSGDITV
jgi:hypothetical protein